ncbi:mycothiol system anti-sigma-R factor [Tomitella biformata]|uniref:mycothiol system anti-sigma-R factor n=1 Tax=Tomitella biformata TaxID=630403 RepID=UPI000464D4DA|nr:mycothiol system anti-sigma-R factor [Tomitella biformata]
MSESLPENLDCSAVIADVWLFLDNECDEATRERLNRHMAGCRACLSTYGIEEQLKVLLGRKCGGEHAPEGLRQRLSIEIRRSVTITRIETGD